MEGGNTGEAGATSAPHVRRLRTLKRRKEEKENNKNQVKLEKVLGLTVTSNACLATAPSTGLVAYPAGCTVVLYNPRKNKQQHIVNPGRKTITAVGWSDDGRYLVTGECGHLPSVRVWDVQDKGVAVAEFPGHKYGINCVSFAPNNKYIVSVGSQHDMIVNVWDWKNNIKVASNKVSSKVKAISFAENGSYFVTAGNRHVKFWYLEYSSRSTKYKEVVPLMGRSAILGEQRNNYFCDVACGRGDMGDSTYAITQSGLLCEFNNRRLLDKWVELRTTSANCLSVGEELIFIGCADGIVRCFSPHTLQFVTTLPRTHFLGVDVSKGLTISHMASHPSDAAYPDTLAISYDEQNARVSVVYNDHSFYIWDVRDIRKVGKSHSFLFHSACIWGLEMYPANLGDGKKPILPPGSFVTCSSDDTIRIWNLDSGMPANTLYRRNIYSEELLKTMYIDPQLNFIKEPDNSTTDKDTLYDQRNGVRCIRISPNGKHLASGDRAGNIRVHELQFMDELCKIEAHDAEVLCLEYGSHNSGNGNSGYLASASRDRLIHVFNAGKHYSFLTTLDDHSSSITAVKFLSGSTPLQMVSCGADKSILFRDVVPGQQGNVSFERSNQIVGKTTLYDMELDRSGKHLLTACQDRNIRVYSVASAKQTKTFKGSASDDGTLIKVVLDRSGIYAATSCTDKTLAIYDYHTGECMASMVGHSELVTGLAFTNDCRHLVSVSGDGCIFVWRLPGDMVSTMQARLASQPNKNATRTYITSPTAEINIDNEEFGSPPPEFLDPNANPAAHMAVDNDPYRFSVGKLPVWAKNKIVQESPPPMQNLSKQYEVPKGRWGNRAAGGAITVKSHYDSDSVIPFPQAPDDDSPKDPSSLEYTRTPLLVGEDDTSMSSMSMSPHPNSMAPPRTRPDTLDSFNDADVDDYSTQDDGGESTEPDTTENTMYFGQMEEKSSDFRVNAMDVEELRRSSRRYRRTEEAGGSQESDEEEESSTPSAEHSDKNILSMLCVSMESVDLVGRREKFLKSNFESLSGNDDLHSLGSTATNSISNAWREGSAVQRNATAIAAARQTRDDAQNRRREELQKRIEETRLKLQNIGYRSMKGSQSINDLSSFPEKEPSGPPGSTLPRAARGKMRPRPRSLLLTALHHSDRLRTLTETNTFHNGMDTTTLINQFTNDKNATAEPEHEGEGEEKRPKASKAVANNSTSTSLRRACSLSDLNKPNVPRRILPAPPNNVSGKKGSGTNSQASTPTRPKSSRSEERDRRPLHERRRSIVDERVSSSPVQSRLEQHERMLQDREKERREAARMQALGRQPSKAELRPNSAADSDRDLPSYMRSTSASVKKEKLVAPIVGNTRRKSITQHAKSTNDLQRIGDMDSSSDEEASKSRRRSSSQDRRGGPVRESPGRNIPSRARSERDLSKVTKVKVLGPPKEALVHRQRTKMKTTTIISNDGAMTVNQPTVAVEPPSPSHMNGVSRGSEEVTRAPLSRELAERTAQTLQEAADNLVKLYKRISLDDDLNDHLRSELMAQISMGAGATAGTLSLVSGGEVAKNNPNGEIASAAMASINQILAKQANGGQGNQNVPQDLSSNPYFQYMFENYSNLMYQNLAAQRLGHQQSQGSQSGNQSPASQPSPRAGGKPQGPSWC